MREVASRVLTILAVLLQGGILDAYIILYSGIQWAPWVITDVLVVGMLIFTYFYSTSYVKKCEACEHDENLRPVGRNHDGRIILGILPLVYASWLFYSIILVAKISFIFKTFGPALDGEETWGTNLLEFVIAGTAGIFAFMMAGRCREPTSSQKVCLDFMQHHVLIEIIDCVEFLTILFVKEHHLHVPSYVTDMILGFACVNLMLPTIGLYQLSATNFTRQKPRENFYIVQTIMSTVFGNIPYLIIRVYLWTDHEFTNALFVMKNIIAIGQNVKELFHYFREYETKLEHNHALINKSTKKRRRDAPLAIADDFNQNLDSRV